MHLQVASGTCALRFRLLYIARPNALASRQGIWTRQQLLLEQKSLTLAALSQRAATLKSRGNTAHRGETGGEPHHLLAPFWLRPSSPSLQAHMERLVACHSAMHSCYRASCCHRTCEIHKSKTSAPSLIVGHHLAWQATQLSLRRQVSHEETFPDAASGACVSCKPPAWPSSGVQALLSSANHSSRLTAAAL